MTPQLGDDEDIRALSPLVRSRLFRCFQCLGSLRFDQLWAVFPEATARPATTAIPCRLAISHVRRPILATHEIARGLVAGARVHAARERPVQFVTPTEIARIRRRPATVSAEPLGALWCSEPPPLTCWRQSP